MIIWEKVSLLRILSPGYSISLAILNLVSILNYPRLRNSLTADKRPGYNMVTQSCIIRMGKDN